MATLNPHKRGDTFKIVNCQLLDENNDPRDLTDISIRSQLRNVRDQVIVEFQVVKNQFAYDLIAPSTEEWPIGMAYMDVEYTESNGTVFSTETIEMQIVRDITR